MTGKRPRRRLDVALVELGLVESRNRAKAMIVEGKVLVGGLPASGPAQQVDHQTAILLKEPDLPFVSRGGQKLDGALESFPIDASGLVCLDAGASTGGFTDCLLKRGAKRVYAVDVGYGQLAWSLRQDERVVVLERQNVRYLKEEQIPEPAELVTGDLSFISLTKVLPALVGAAAERAIFLLLVKPQFELGPGRVGKGGVVRDDADRAEAVDGVAAAAAALGLEERGRADSVLSGPKGNREIFLWMEKTPALSPSRLT